MGVAEITFKGNSRSNLITRTGAALLVAVMVLALGGCSRPPGPVVVFGSPDSPRLRQTLAGLRSRLGAAPLKVVLFPEFGPQGAQDLQRLRRANPRLLIVLGTPALLLAASVVKTVPVVFGMVANPYFTGAAYEPEHPGLHQDNITGIASPAPVTAALRHGTSLLGKGAWGLLYDPTDGVAVDLARRFVNDAPRFGVKPVTETSTAAATDGAALKRLLEKDVRVIYLPPAASTARYAPLVLEWGRQLQVRVVSSYPEGEHRGALLWVTLDYRLLGQDVGDLARRVLAGENPQAMAIMEKTPLKVEVDETLARKWSGYPPVIR
jgi:ABC-type uncharacterized transport system substrate-binding protein